MVGAGPYVASRMREEQVIGNSEVALLLTAPAVTDPALLEHFVITSWTLAAKWLRCF